MDVSEAPGWDGDGLHRYHVQPGGLGPLAVLAVLAPGVVEPEPEPKLITVPEPELQ